MVLLLGCASPAVAPVVSTPGIFVSPTAMLATVPRQPSSVGGPGRLLYGAHRHSELPNRRISTGDYQVTFQPHWSQETDLGVHEPAVAYYVFNMADFTGPPAIALDWDNPAPAESAVFIGLGDLDRDAWTWHAAPARLPSITPYVNEAGQLLLAVVVLGLEEAVLNWVRFGEPAIVAGVDLTRLYAPPLEFETAAVIEDWQDRDISVQDYTVVHSEFDDDFFQTLVVSHTVDGLTHYGLVRVPPYPALKSFGVLVYCHGGSNGAWASDLFNIDHIWVNSDVVTESYIMVMPAFRGESLDAGAAGTYQSGGERDIYDRDADDALALLNCVLARFNSADPGRIAVMGLSRGAQVAQRLAQRDQRIAGVVDFYGVTDEWLPSLQEQSAADLAAAAAGTDITGYPWGTLLDGLRLGTVDQWEARNYLLRVSTVCYAGRFPRLQIHHGTADGSVSVEHSDRLDAVLQATPGAQWEYFRYPGGTHSPDTLDGSAERVAAFLESLL